MSGFELVLVLVVCEHVPVVAPELVLALVCTVVRPVDPAAEPATPSEVTVVPVALVAGARARQLVCSVCRSGGAADCERAPSAWLTCMHQFALDWSD